MKSMIDVMAKRANLTINKGSVSLKIKSFDPEVVPATVTFKNCKKFDELSEAVDTAEKRDISAKKKDALSFEGGTADLQKKVPLSLPAARRLICVLEGREAEIGEGMIDTAPVEE